MRELKAEEVVFVESVEDEDAPVKGSFALGDDEEDLAQEQELIDRIYRGDNSAWCVLTVKATWGSFKGYASLGGYTFPEGNTDEQNTEYAAEDFEDLRNQALAALNEQIRNTQAELSKLY